MKTDSPTINSLPFFRNGDVTLYHGDCRDVLKTLDSESVDAVVTDPPYELGFMGKSWDSSGVAYDVDLWREVLRVLKPGGHLLAFGGTRTYHRMVVAIEDSGFEIRDQLQWLYGSGFPKNLDVSKAIDKMHGAEREVVSTGKSVKRMIPGADQSKTGSWIKDNGREFTPTETRPVTEDAKKWEGFGTALKPANEPICLARKPFKASVAANVLAHGTGAINIDACRIPVMDADYARNCSGDRGHDQNRERQMDFGMTAGSSNEKGRFPANVIHDGSEDVLEHFPSTSSGVMKAGTVRGEEIKRNAYSKISGNATDVDTYGDAGSAARFFYCAKPSQAERDAGLDGFEMREAGLKNETNRGLNYDDPHKAILRRNHHPTVKPVALMEYLCRLVTPPGGVILDPFCGSGTTGKAAFAARFRFIGIEQQVEFLDIARCRIISTQQGLF